MDTPRIEFIATGNELLDGSISDTNSRWLAERLRPFGLRLDHISIVPDDPKEIQREFLQSFTRSKIIVFSGGLGPTTDDLTLEVVAEFLSRPMIFSKVAYQNIRERMKALGRKQWNAGHEKQCLVPEGSEILKNSAGTAPGVCLKVEGREIYFFPGVPSEFFYLSEHYFLPRMAKVSGKKGGEHLFVYKVFGWPESELNELMKRAKVPSGVEVGYRTALPENHLKFFVEGKSRTEARRRLEPLDRWLTKELGAFCFSTQPDETFAGALLRELKAKKLKVAVAESCSGGLLSSSITAEAGSSEVFDRGFITYSNEAKVQELGVKPETLARDGAVSESVAREMAWGALMQSTADRSVALTGISGPSGGTAKKPVGLVWIAWADRRSKKIRSESFFFPFGRNLHQKFSSAVAYFGLVHPEARFTKWSQPKGTNA